MSGVGPKCLSPPTVDHLFMTVFQVVILHEQSPPHESLVVVMHAVEKNVGYNQ